MHTNLLSSSLTASQESNQRRQSNRDMNLKDNNQSLCYEVSTPMQTVFPGNNNKNILFVIVSIKKCLLFCYNFFFQGQPKDCRHRKNNAPKDFDGGFF